MAGEAPASATLDEIASRSSARTLDASRSVGGAAFRWSLAASLRGSRVPHFVAVHAVDDVEPGLYRWPALDAPLRAGDLRDGLYRVCWDQPLGRDAAFVTLAAADLGGLDDRGYRDAQIDAGIVCGRLHLAAHALGIGASGMTFVDAEIEPFLGTPWSGLLLTCVGVPVRHGWSGGPPGEPLILPPPPPAA